MRFVYLSLIFRRVAKSLRELIWTHFLTSATMAMTLFVFGGFLLLHDNLQSLLRGWGHRIQIVAYLKEALAAADYQALVAEIRSLPEIESVRYISKETAWQDFKQSLGTQAGLLDGLDPNLLPSSLEITVKPSYRHRPSVEALAARLKKTPGVSEVEYPQEWVDGLNLVLLGVQWAQWIIGGLLFLATFFIVGNTSKLAILARKEEIEIMQLVGAPNALIRIPLIFEGMIQGTAGALASLSFLGLLFLLVRYQLAPSLAVYIAEDQFRFFDLRGTLLVLSLGWLLGASGALFSVRRFLQR